MLQRAPEHKERRARQRPEGESDAAGPARCSACGAAMPASDQRCLRAATAGGELGAPGSYRQAMDMAPATPSPARALPGLSRTAAHGALRLAGGTSVRVPLHSFGRGARPRLGVLFPILLDVDAGRRCSRGRFAHDGANGPPHHAARPRDGQTADGRERPARLKRVLCVISVRLKSLCEPPSASPAPPQHSGIDPCASTATA